MTPQTSPEPGTARGARGQGMGRIVAVNLALLATLLLAVEALFGTWFSDEALPVNVLTDVHLVGVEGAPIYPGRREITYTRDRFGLRGNYGTPGEVDVLAVGGSTTDCRGLDDGDDWPSVLAREFNASVPGRQVRVANAGADGMSTVGHLHAFDHWFPGIPELRPRFVLFFVGVNDTALPADAGDGTRFDAVALRPASRLGRLALDLRERSALWRAWRVLDGMHEARLMLSGFVPQSRRAYADPDQRVGVRRLAVLQADYRASHRARLEAYHARLVRLASMSRAFGSEPIFVTQPAATFRRRDGVLYVVRDRSIDASIALDEFNAVTMTACAETGSTCVDLAGGLALDPADYYDRVHYTVSGARKIGAFLAARLDGVLDDR